MINARKQFKMAKKWKKFVDAGSCGTSSAAPKGHFVANIVYQKGFTIPLNYINSPVIRELFEQAGNEFGLPSGCPITLPCDAAFMEYAIFLIRIGAPEDVEKALVISMATGNCLPSSSILHQENSNQQSLISS